MSSHRHPKGKDLVKPVPCSVTCKRWNYYMTSTYPLRFCVIPVVTRSLVSPGAVQAVAADGAVRRAAAAERGADAAGARHAARAPARLLLRPRARAPRCRRRLTTTPSSIYRKHPRTELMLKLSGVRGGRDVMLRLVSQKLTGAALHVTSHKDYYGALSDGSQANQNYYRGKLCSV